MRYSIEVGGRTREVVVRRDGDAFTVAVDGRAWQVEAARIDSQTLSIIVGPNRESHEVAVAPDAAHGRLEIQVDGVNVSASAAGRRRWGAADGHAGDGPQRVVAPMPGKIVRVLVAAGDVVRARQGLVVMEAMKMENELRALGDGTVAEVRARVGASVDAGALLVVVR